MPVAQTSAREIDGLEQVVALVLADVLRQAEPEVGEIDGGVVVDEQSDTREHGHCVKDVGTAMGTSSAFRCETGVEEQHVPPLVLLDVAGLAEREVADTIDRANLISPRQWSSRKLL